MKAVLDTNVVISATLIPGGNEDRILRRWQRGEFELVLSPPILEEMGRALLYERLRKFRWMTEAEVIMLLGSLAHESLLVSGRVTVTASRDPDDDKFVSAAVEAGAEYVVTGDKDLLELKRYGEVLMVTPKAFLRILGETG
jgi:putative PIN family toxin of toxin-antitoxin system